MRLVLLGSRDTIIGKNDGRKDFREILKDEEIYYSMKEILYIYIYIYIYIYLTNVERFDQLPKNMIIFDQPLKNVVRFDQPPKKVERIDHTPKSV